MCVGGLVGEQNVVKMEIRFSTPNPFGRVVFGVSQISIFQIEIGGGGVGGCQKFGTKIEIFKH